MICRPLLPLSLCALGLLLLGCGQTHPAKSAQALAGTSGRGVRHLTTTTFDGTLAQDKPVLVDFWAPWCGPCRTQGPILDEAAGQIGDRALVGKVNVDEERALAQRYGVRVIPTLILLRGGQELQRFTGVQSAETLVKALEDAGK